MWIWAIRFFGLALPVAAALAQPLPAAAAQQARAEASPDSALAAALQAAWQRSTVRLELEDARELAQVDLTLARRTWVQPPVLDLSHQHGDDKRETETGVALPLWRPGQRSAQQAAVRARFGWQQAAQAAARLALADQVREAAWRVVLAQMQHQWHGVQLDLLQGLQADVARRVQAGELAQIDATRVQTRHLQAQVAHEQSGQDWQQALSEWQVLTGLDAPPPRLAWLSVHLLPIDTATDAAPGLPCHPEVCLAEQEITLAQRRSAAIGKDHPHPPALLLRLRQERGHGTATHAGNGANNRANNSVRVGLSIPLGADSQHTAQRAAAALQIDDARVARQKLLIRLKASQAVAHGQLQSTRRQWDAARERNSLLQQQSAWLKTAFEAGQVSLSDYLQAQMDAAAARADALRQQAALGRAHSRWLQAMGKLP